MKCHLIALGAFLAIAGTAAAGDPEARARAALALSLPPQTASPVSPAPTYAATLARAKVDGKLLVVWVAMAPTLLLPSCTHYCCAEHLFTTEGFIVVDPATGSAWTFAPWDDEATIERVTGRQVRARYIQPQTFSPMRVNSPALPISFGGGGGRGC